jgi:hypothetical protein
MIDITTVIVLISIIMLWVVAPFMIIGYILKIIGLKKFGEAIHTVIYYLVLYFIIIIVLAAAFSITTNIMFYVLHIDLTSVSQFEEFIKLKWF